MVVVMEVVAAAEVSHTLSAERGGRGGCPKWVVFCSSQAGRVVQTRGAPHQPTLFTIPRWLAGGAAHLDLVITNHPHLQWHFAGILHPPRSEVEINTISA